MKKYRTCVLSSRFSRPPFKFFAPMQRIEQIGFDLIAFRASKSEDSAFNLSRGGSNVGTVGDKSNHQQNSLSWSPFVQPY